MIISTLDTHTLINFPIFSEHVSFVHLLSHNGKTIEFSELPSKYTLTCSNSTIETLQKGAIYIQS